MQEAIEREYRSWRPSSERSLNYARKMKIEEAQLNISKHQGAIGSKFLDKIKNKTVEVTRIRPELIKITDGKNYPADYDVMFRCNPTGRELPYYVSINHFKKYFELLI